MFPGCHRSLFSQSPPGHFCFLYPLPLVGPPVWHHLFPSPLCHSSISLSQTPSGLSSVQKGTLRQERLQKHLPASLSLPLCPALSPHTLPLPTASITQPRYLPSSSSTHLHQLLLGVPRCLEATVAVPGAPLSLAPGHTARSCWAPVRDLVCARTSGKSKPA